jgi:hypothetical protein
MQKQLVSSSNIVLHNICLPVSFFMAHSDTFLSVKACEIQAIKKQSFSSYMYMKYREQLHLSP